LLSIGKVSAGQAGYFLEQAEVSVDAVTSIGIGLEDYDVDGGEACGFSPQLRLAAPSRTPQGYLRRTEVGPRADSR
jgi:hypothetical protein